MRTKVSLIVQDGAMIPQTEVPSLPVDVRYTQRVMEVVPTTVRFLRSGCPAVQWVVTADALLHPEGDPGRTKILDTVQNALSNLQRPSENFRIQAPTGAWGPGTVITLSRIVAKKTEEATFGQLKPLDKFFQEEGGIEYQHALHPIGVDWEPVAMALDGSYRGRIVRFSADEAVLKVIE